MRKKYSKDDVVTISGTIWNDNTRTVANAVNINADILKNVLSRLEELEQKVKDHTSCQP